MTFEFLGENLSLPDKADTTTPLTQTQPKTRLGLKPSCCCCFFSPPVSFFLGPHLWHMEVPRLGV